MSRRRSSRSPSPPPPYYTPPRLPKSSTKPPHPSKVQRTAKNTEKREIVVDGAEGNEYTLWGERWNAGKVLYTFSPAANPTSLWVVTELQAGADSVGGECDGLIDVSLSSGEPWPGATRIQTWWYAGTAAGQIDANLAAIDPSWNEALPGTCYGVTHYKGWGLYWKKFDPVLWHYRGKKCLIPETQAFAYSIKSFDQVYSYLRYGRGKALSLAEIDTTAFINAKAADLAAGLAFESHLSLMGDEADPDDVIEMLRVLTQSWIFPDESGRYTIIPDRAAAPTQTVTETAVSKTTKTKIAHKHDARERPNSVTVWWTDIANGRQLVPKKVVTPAVNSGSVKEVPIEYKIPDVYLGALADKHAAYILNSYQFDLAVTERWNVKAEAIPIGTVVDRVLEKRGDRHFVSRLLRRSKNPNNTSDVELVHHDNLKFSATVVAVPPKIQSTLPSVHAEPPNLILGTIGWSVELYQDTTLTWLPRGVLTFVPPTDFPWIDGYEVWLSINGGPSRWWFNAATSPARSPTLMESGTYQLTIKTRQSVTGSLSSGTVVNVSVASVSQPPPPGDFLGSKSTGWYLDNPPQRVLQAFAAGAWSGVNMTTFVAANIGDGNESTTAFKFGDQTVVRSVTLACGSPIAIREFEFVLSAPIAGTYFPFVGGKHSLFLYYADAPGGPWTLVVITIKPSDLAYQRYIWRVPSSIGARAYWKWEQGVSSNSDGFLSNVTEVKCYTYGAAYTQVAQCIITHLIGYPTKGSPVFEQRRIAPPTAANRLTQSDLEVHLIGTSETVHGGYGSEYFYNVAFIQNVSPKGEVSAPRLLYDATFTDGAPSGFGEPQFWQPNQTLEVELSSATTNDLQVSYNVSVIRLTATAGAKTLTGLAHGYGGRFVMIENVSIETITLPHDTGSVAANRWWFVDGTSKTLGPGMRRLFAYDSNAARWTDLGIVYTDANGRVGIKRAATAAALEVDTPGAGQAQIHLYGNQQYNGLQIRNAGNTTWSTLLYDSTNKLMIVHAGETGSGVVLWTESVERARFKSTGMRLGGSGAEISQFLSGSKTWDPASLPGGDFTITTVTVTGAAVGNKAIASFTSQTDGSVDLPAQVLAPNTVTVTLKNLDPANGINLSSGTLSVLVIKHT